MKKQEQSAWGVTAKAVVIAFGRYFALPALLYIVIFFLTQSHYIGHFSDGFYLDNGDGFQNVWNVWWVNESITELDQNPYYTNILHWPHGTTLVPQTMNIFNGLMALPLMNWFGFNLFEAINFAVVFSFVIGGVTMFWFIQKLCGKYWVSLIAGALFTFSSYHFAHALGHLQLVSLEWIPLFLLAFWTLMEKLQYRYTFPTAFALFLVMLCDYYYLFWCVILGAMWFVWRVYKREFTFTKHNVKVMAVFVAFCLALMGPLVHALMGLNTPEDPLLGSHDPTLFGLDPLSILIPGGVWYWNTLTDWHWTHLPYASETSMFFGFGLLTVLAIAWYKRFWLKDKLRAPSWLNFWWIVLFVFGVIALGPRLNLFGRTADFIPLPYAFLEKIFPMLEISGMPIRWILISLIAAIVIVSFMLTKLDLKKTRGKQLLVLFIVVSAVDLWPAQLPLTLIPTSKYVTFLQQQPNGAVIDNAAVSGSQQLRNQTIHEKPMAFGYMTRLPKSVDDKDFQIFADLEEGRYGELCTQHKVRYVTLPPSRPFKNDQFPVVYQDKEALVYDLKKAGGC